MKNQNRFELLKQWLDTVVNGPVGALRPASGDASFRRYFRLHCAGKSLIAMDAPPDKEDSRSFVMLAQALAAMGLNVPEVLAYDLEAGFVLLSDLGECQYLEALDESSAERLYRDAIEALGRLQRGGRERPVAVPVYDRQLLMQEMALFPEWLLNKQLALELSPRQRQDLSDVFETLITAALAQPQVLVHRDYHSRNLMVTPVDNPGILDFQDAVYGPMSYDLVSLLRDCYIEWPLERVRHWVSDYLAVSRESGGVKAGPDQFWYWFDLMGVQRHLKAAGIFARLNIRDAKPGYLADIPRTLGYVKAVSDRHTELRPLYSLLVDHVEPHLARLTGR